MGKVNRFEAAEKYKNHPYLKKSFLRLNKSDWDYIYAWLKRTEGLSAGELVSSANRLFMDETNKPKNWKVIFEFASNFSSSVYYVEESQA